MFDNNILEVDDIFEPIKNVFVRKNFNFVGQILGIYEENITTLKILQCVNHNVIGFQRY